jgi:paraquat-inducible protein B
MDEDCNIVPMSREEEELPFTIDCTDFLRDIFVSNAYLEEGLVDPEGDTTHQFLVIEFTRWLEPDIEHDDDQSVTPHTIRIDLTELWKLDNYYDKWKIDEIVAAIYQKIAEEVATLNNRITNEVNTLNNKIDSTKSELNQTINNTKNELNQSITNTKNEIDNSINNTKQELQ